MHAVTSPTTHHADYHALFPFDGVAPLVSEVLHLFGRTSSISSRVACSFMEMIIFPALSLIFRPLKQKTHCCEMGRIFFSLLKSAYRNAPRHLGWVDR